MLLIEDMAMRTAIDIAPLHRVGIGFDRMFDLLEATARAQAADNWPPFDSIRLSEDRYRIVMAVAGFAREELDISVQANMLTVSGERKGEQEGEVLHRGIANRPFSRRFELAEHVQVTGAQLKDGLLTIDLRREVPEALRPRRIEIGTTDAATPIRQLESQAA
jgi:molecular chaperone IbpA